MRQNLLARTISAQKTGKQWLNISNSSLVLMERELAATEKALSGETSATAQLDKSLAALSGKISLVGSELKASAAHYAATGNATAGLIAQDKLLYQQMELQKQKCAELQGALDKLAANPPPPRG
jgi:septal ring factor EnvC (AmiA/AmiB activator)